MGDTTDTESALSTTVTSTRYGDYIAASACPISARTTNGTLDVYNGNSATDLVVDCIGYLSPNPPGASAPVDNSGPYPRGGAA